MPESRYNCADCKLHDIDMPYSVVDVEAINLQTSRAVAAMVGVESAEILPETPPDVIDKARICADMILSGECTMWQKSRRAGGGLAFKRSSRKKK